jgi:hypothetical protein
VFSIGGSILAGVPRILNLEKLLHLLQTRKTRKQPIVTARVTRNFPLVGWRYPRRWSRAMSAQPRAFIQRRA